MLRYRAFDILRVYSGLVFLEISKKVLLCQVLKVKFSGAKTHFNLMCFISFKDFNAFNALKLWICISVVNMYICKIQLCMNDI